MSGLARRVARSLLRSSMVNSAARTFARVRGHGLVLVYHRLGPPAPPGCEILPSVPVDVFRAQVQALAEVVDLVTIDAIVGADGGRTDRRRPAVAITFDDDLPSHVEYALPALQDLGVPATFFLSGRALHGTGAYWFQHLEALLVARGAARTAGLLGLQGDAASLTMACARDAGLRRRVRALTEELPPPAILERAGVAALGAAGMAIGFHTLEHDIIPTLDDGALAAAVSHGRAELTTASGCDVRHFAYPYGKADDRSAAAVRRAGFQSAFTGQPRPIRHGDDRFRLGRWEPGPLGVDELLVNVAVRLHRISRPPTE